MKPRKPTKRPPALWPRLWPYGLLAALACAVYANALGNGFVSDDRFQLVGNPLAADWRRLPDIFQHDVWAFTGAGISNYYRPLQTVVYLALHSLCGFDPLAFHLVQVLLHAANTLLVFRLAERLLAERTPALVAAMLFAVHPVHSEAVVWVAVLPDVLMTLVVLAALVCFLGGGRIAVLAALYFVALLVKEPAAVLPLLLAGYEFLFAGRPLRRIWSQNGRLYGALAGVFAVYLGLRLHALGGFAPAEGGHHAWRGWTLAWSVAAAFGQELALLAAPWHFNYFRVFDPVTGPSLAVLASLAAAAAILAAMIRFRPGAVSYSLWLMVLPLLPVLNLNGVGANVVAERYLYLPSVGFVLLAAAGWRWLAARQRRTAWGLAGIVMAISAGMVLARNPDWHDEERLLTVTTAQSPRAVLPLSDLGTYYFGRGEFDKAIAKYRAALALDAANAELHHNLGNAYQQKGSYAEAAAELRRAIELDPRYAEAHMSLGLTLAESGDTDGAIAEDQKALALRPDYPEAQANLAMIRIRQKDYAAAIELLQRALASNPRNFEAYVNLGVAYNFTGRFADAADALRRAIEIAPEGKASLYLAHYYLGVSYAQMHLADKANDEFAAALRLHPDFAPAKQALGETPH